MTSEVRTLTNKCHFEFVKKRRPIIPNVGDLGGEVNTHAMGEALSITQSFVKLNEVKYLVP